MSEEQKITNEEYEASQKKTFKVLGIIMAILAVVYFAPPFLKKTDSIDGHSRQAASKSAMQMRRFMPTNERNLFDTAYHIVDQVKSKESDEAFLQAVDGLSAQQIIELAKHELTIKIAAGDPAFKQYTSWEDMVQQQHKAMSGGN